MKIYLLLLISFIICGQAFSQTTYTTSEAKDHIGDSAVVRGVISEIFTSDKGNIFVSFDNKYPDHTFSVVLFKRDNLDIKALTVGKTVTVQGQIISFNSKPEIILKRQDQIIKVE